MSYLEEVIYKVSNISFVGVVLSMIFLAVTFLITLFSDADDEEDNKFLADIKYYNKIAIYIFIINLILYILLPCIEKG